jgi:WD40 repeat protein
LSRVLAKSSTISGIFAREVEPHVRLRASCLAMNVNNNANEESLTETLSVNFGSITKQTRDSFHQTGEEPAVPFAEVTAMDLDLVGTADTVVVHAEDVRAAISEHHDHLVLEDAIYNPPAIVSQVVFTSEHNLPSLTQQTSSFSSNISEEAMHREHSLVTEQEIVEIDEDCDASDSGFDQDPMELKTFYLIKSYCWIVVGCSFTMFAIGSIGIILIALNIISFSRIEAHPTQIIPSPVLPIGQGEDRKPFDAAPSAPSPTISSAPSEMPSCNGLYEKVSSITISQSGSDEFTMSNDGTTIVVANYDGAQGISYLETFHTFASHVSQVKSTESYFLSDLQISADGSTLVLGTHTYPQGDSMQVGGAVIVLENAELNGKGDWKIRHELFTGGGKLGLVHCVAVSDDGRTLAFLTRDSYNAYYVEVYKEDDEQEKMLILGKRLRQSYADENSLIAISGDGLRVFITSGENQVRSYDYLDDKWLQFASVIIYNGISPMPYSSYDGKILALSSSFGFSIVLFEAYKGEGIEQWNKIGVFDITSTSQSQYTAISANGHNVIVADVLSSQKSLARLYRKSGSLYTQLQDFSLPSGIFRGIQLDETGEQLTVAIDNEVTVYRKDCPT